LPVLFTIFLFGLGLGERMLFGLLFGSLRCLARSFFLILLLGLTFLFKSLFFFLPLSFLCFILSQLLFRLFFALLLKLASHTFSLFGCVTQLPLRFLLLKQTFLFLLLLPLPDLLLSFSLSLLKALEFFLNLELFVFGGLSLLNFFNEGPHPLLRELDQLFEPLSGLKLWQLTQDGFTRIPHWSKITFSFFFSDDFFENAFDRLFAALGVLVVEDVNDLLLRLEGRVTGADQVGSETKDRVGVALTQLIHLFMLLYGQGKALAAKGQDREVYQCLRSRASLVDAERLAVRYLERRVLLLEALATQRNLLLFFFFVSVHVAEIVLTD